MYANMSRACAEAQTTPTRTRTRVRTHTHVHTHTHTNTHERMRTLAHTPKRYTVKCADKQESELLNDTAIVGERAMERSSDRALDPYQSGDVERQHARETLQTGS